MSKKVINSYLTLCNYCEKKKPSQFCRELTGVKIAGKAPVICRVCEANLREEAKKEAK